MIADGLSGPWKITGNIAETQLFLHRDLALDEATGTGTKNPQRDGLDIMSGTGKLQAVIHD